MMIDIQHIDDHKEKWQSHEYHYDALNELGEAYYSVNIIGYGKNKKESAEELYLTLKTVRDEIDEALKQLKEEI